MIPPKKRSHAVKRSKFTEQQIAYALKQAELGTPVEEVCRKMGISDATFYNWKKKYGGLGPSEVRRLKQLEEEHTTVKKALKPSRKRLLIDELRDRYKASLSQACSLFRVSRSLYAYKSRARDATPLVMRIKEIAATRVHYGYRRVHDAQAGRLARQSQTRLSPIPGRRAVTAPETSQEKQVSQIAPAKAAGYSHEPDLEHGFCG